MNRQAHWNQVYQTKAPDDVSWFQTRPTLSLKLIANTCIARDNGIIDVGGGASPLVDCLLDAGFQQIAVLDLSAAALEQSKRRLGKRAAAVTWFEADVTKFRPAQTFTAWHDRAVFHFLTDPEDRAKYVETLKHVLTPGGHVIIATFAKDGPQRCSGLEIVRYDAAGIGTELGSEFRLAEQVNETHVTPWNSGQKFIYCRFIRESVRSRESAGQTAQNSKS
ncbi:MAG TPA: class I SAM-dependent methyltransferase [Verrucomicrobiae bacterium]|nr:class I SAM-dependent methyltransferase [Verrucomicrobiae bacterium]